MVLITHRELIRKVVERWERQYPPKTAEPDKTKKGDDLRKLNLETATIHDVEKVIGNYSWTRLKCDDCGREDDDLDTVVQVGQEPDYESATALLCKECAKRAFSLFT